MIGKFDNSPIFRGETLIGQHGTQAGGAELAGAMIHEAHGSVACAGRCAAITSLAILGKTLLTGPSPAPWQGCHLADRGAWGREWSGVAFHQSALE